MNKPQQVRVILLVPLVAEFRNFKSKRKPKKKLREKNSSKMQKYVGKYSVVSELSISNCFLTFGQLLCRDADWATKIIRRLFCKQSVPRVTVVSNRNSCLLRVAPLKVYGTDVWDLVHSRAVPNVVVHAYIYRGILRQGRWQWIMEIVHLVSAPCWIFLPLSEKKWSNWTTLLSKRLCLKLGLDFLHSHLCARA